jgi:hypothetical protein
MASAEGPGDPGLASRKLSDRDRRTLGFGASLVGVLSGVAQFLAADSVPKGLRLLGLSAGVVLLGAALTLGAVKLWRSGDRPVTLRLNVVVLAVSLFVTLGVVGGLVGHGLGVSARDEPTGSPKVPGATVTSATAGPSPAESGSAASPACPYPLGDAGVVEARTVSPHTDLVICPVLLNNGAPITGPFPVAGRFIGPADRFRDLVIVNRGDPETCDAKGNRPTGGLILDRGLVIKDDGSWSFTDGLGYPEAVTLARYYQIVSAPPASIEVIKSDRDRWNSTHANPDDYPGMAALPADAKVLAIFRQPPGKYNGKGSPCKNS